MQQSVLQTVDDEPLLSLRVSLKDGSRYEAPAALGFNLMELLRMSGLPVKAECGGACVCATCHVRVPLRWQRRLPAPTEEELAKLDEIPGADETSRLACQIRMTLRLHGLEIEVQPESLHPQTYWVAG